MAVVLRLEDAAVDSIERLSPREPMAVDYNNLNGDDRYLTARRDYFDRDELAENRKDWAE